MKHIDEFGDDEKKAIIEEATVDMVGAVKLSEKYSTMVSVVRTIVHKAGFFLAPDDLSKYPDFPVKPDEMSVDDYQKILKKYLKRQKNKRAKINMQNKRDNENKNGKNDNDDEIGKISDADEEMDY